MCGIVGYLESVPSTLEEQMVDRIEKMKKQLIHRGPDDEGHWIDPALGVALGHRRLAILDLSPRGHQPMKSANERFVIVFNGEIYNSKDRQHELGNLGHVFKGSSDTEVILAAVVQWGFATALARFNGMFAIAVWDRQLHQLMLARDRVGKKPLYYGKVGVSTWAFASELKALRAMPESNSSISLAAMTAYTRYGFVPSPYSIYEHIFKLPAGSWIVLGEGFERPEPRNYAPWMTTSESLHSALKGAVSRRMLSDVPLGALLSGGTDSSLIVALMQEQSAKPVKTFSLGLLDASLDEARYAKKIAHILGTEHTEFYVTSKEAQRVIPSLPSVYDEPFSDSSQIPTIIVCELAKSSVTVVLSGDGGDELFGGYLRYHWSRTFWQLSRHLPEPTRRLVARLITTIGPKILPFSPGWQEKCLRLADLLKLSSPRELYRSLLSPWREPESLLNRWEQPTTYVDLADEDKDVFRWMMKLDFGFYLPDDILVKVDRASMSVGLEARCPLLDYDVIETAKLFQTSELTDRRESKAPLLAMLKSYVPAYNHPKKGFAVPISQWLRSDLKMWAEELLSDVGEDGWYRREPILRRWREHQSGTRDWSASLWTVLMFQAWLRR